MKTITGKALEKRLQDFPDWTQEDDKLVSGFQFENFTQAVSFVNAIAQIAEVINHHPDIYIFDYKYVKVLTSTHNPKGFTNMDFKLMEKLDELTESEDTQT